MMYVGSDAVFGITGLGQGSFLEKVLAMCCCQSKEFRDIDDSCIASLCVHSSVLGTVHRVMTDATNLIVCCSANVLYKSQLVCTA